MIPLFRSVNKLVATSAFAIATFSLLACGGSGVGDEGWAPDSPEGYSVKINTTAGSINNANPGVLIMKFLSKNEAQVSASTVVSSPFAKTIIATYLKTGPNTFTVSFDDKSSPSAPTTRTAVFEAQCTVDTYDNNTKYILGTATWSYKGWFNGNNVTTEESGSGSGAPVELTI